MRPSERLKILNEITDTLGEKYTKAVSRTTPSESFIEELKDKFIVASQAQSAVEEYLLELNRN